MSAHFVKHPRRSTSHDVAKAAGVSRTTVSFVLNDVPGQSIPAATREAVLQAAAELGYVPSAAARSLRSGQSHLVLCLATDWEPSALMDEALTLMSRGLRKAGLAVAIAKLSADAADDDVLWSAISAEVVVAMFDLPTRVRERLRRMHVPVVEMYLSSRGADTPTDDVQKSIGRLQADYLIGRGSETLVHVVPELPDDHDVIRDRVAGAHSAARDHGVEIRLAQVPLNGALPAAAARDIFHHAGEVSTPGLPRLGICAYNDVVALRVVAAGRELGVAAPGDYRVIGVDDSPSSAFVDPPLTSVRLNLEALNEFVVGDVLRALGLATGRARLEPLIHLVPRASA